MFATGHTTRGMSPRRRRAVVTPTRPSRLGRVTRVVTNGKLPEWNRAVEAPGRG